MKFVSISLLAAAILFNSSIASAEFVLENSPGANGDIFDSFPTFTLVGSNGGYYPGDGSAILTTYSDTFTTDTTVKFDFTYISQDDGGSWHDTAGYFVNNVFTRLSPLDQPPFSEAFSGSAIVSVLAGEKFGFYINAGDGGFGGAFLRVDADLNPTTVPVPAALPLMASALGIFGIARRHNKSKIV